MEKGEKKIDPAATRLWGLIEQLGGAATVARQMGKHPQLFYNLRDGKSKFSLTTLAMIAKAFPGKVNANFILFGEEPEQAHTATVVNSKPETSPAVISQTNIDWKVLYEREYEEKLRIGALNDHLTLALLERDGKMQDNEEYSKMLSSSHTTAGNNFDIFGSVGVSQDRTSERDAMRVKGFEVGQASASENEVKIVKMPVDYFTHVKVNRLNSLAPMVKKTA